VSMTQIFAILFISLLALLMAWCYGRFHISLVDKPGVGKLTPARFTYQRLPVYGGPFVVLFGKLNWFEHALNQLVGTWKLLFVSCLVLTCLFGGIVLALSILEAFWLNSGELPVYTKRHRRFKSYVLPLLYGSLYGFWFGFLPTCFFLWQSWR
jgi:hypothetical protein